MVFIEWFNVNKTEAIIFGTSQRLRTSIVTKPTLSFLSVPLDFSETVKILGVTLDESLTMNRQVTKTLFLVAIIIYVPYVIYALVLQHQLQ